MKNQTSLKLSTHLRKKLKEPLGNLISNIKNIKKRDLKDKLIICVGDITTERILNLRVKPKICVYDGKVMRKERKIPEVIKNFKAKEVCVNNPRGFLNREVFNVIRKSLKSKSNLKIFISGEEDLVTLAAIHSSSPGTIVLYGQPNEGLVVVNVNKKIKDKVKKILDSMSPFLK